MLGQLCWLPSSDREDQLILQLRENSFAPWLPYSAYSQYKVPDYLIPGGSKGWSTCQKLLQAGWTLIPTAQAQSTVARSEAQQSKSQLQYHSRSSSS